MDEYHDESNSSSSSSSSSGSGSSVSNSSNEHYSSGVPLEVLQEKLRQRTATNSSAGPSFRVPTSIPSSSEEEEKDILYCYVVGVPSRIDKKKLDSIRSWYQIPDDLNPHLAI